MLERIKAFWKTLQEGIDGYAYASSGMVTYYIIMMEMERLRYKPTFQDWVNYDSR